MKKDLLGVDVKLIILVIAVAAVFWMAFEASQVPVDVGPTQCVYKNEVYDTGERICGGKEKDTEAKHLWLCKNSDWYYEETCDSAELCMKTGTRNAFCAFSLETLDETPLKGVGGAVGGLIGTPV